jgi:hypothetical protein
MIGCRGKLTAANQAGLQSLLSEVMQRSAAQLPQHLPRELTGSLVALAHLGPTKHLQQQLEQEKQLQQYVLDVALECKAR